MAKLGKMRRMCERAMAIDEKELLHEIFDDKLLQAQIIDLNQEQLYDKGIQSDGSPTGEYAPITISYYKPKAKADGRDGRSDHITGKDTGQTYESMRVDNLPDGFIIHAEDRNNFFDREPKGLGLTKQSVGEIMPAVKDIGREIIREKIFS